MLSLALRFVIYVSRVSCLSAPKGRVVPASRAQADLGNALKTPPTRPKRGLLGWLDGAEELSVYLPQRRKA